MAATQKEQITQLQQEVEKLQRQVKQLFATAVFRKEAVKADEGRMVTVTCTKCKGRETMKVSEASGWRTHKVCPAAAAE